MYQPVLPFVSAFLDKGQNAAEKVGKPQQTNLFYTNSLEKSVDTREATDDNSNIQGEKRHEFQHKCLTLYNLLKYPMRSWLIAVMVLFMNL